MNRIQNNILKLENIFLVFLVVSWFFEVKFSLDGLERYVIYPRVLNIVFLIFYYTTSTKKIKLLYLIFLLELLIPAILFALNNYDWLAMVFIAISRILLICLILSYKEKMEGKLKIRVLSLFAIVLCFLSFLFYKNIAFFYVSALATVILIALLTITFTRLLSLGAKRGNLEMFIGTAIFLIADAFFGSKKLTSNEIIYPILSATCYLIAYFLITKSVLKED